MRSVRAAMSSVALFCVLVADPAVARAAETNFLDRVNAGGMPLTDNKALTGHAACLSKSSVIHR
jgi:hypothetical protein